MQHVNVIINRVGDPPSLPNIRPIAEVEILHVVVLEKGMASGAASITFVMTQLDGKHLVSTMSAGMFQVISGAIAGAEKRFASVPT